MKKPQERSTKPARPRRIFFLLCASVALIGLSVCCIYAFFDSEDIRNPNPPTTIVITEIVGDQEGRVHQLGGYKNQDLLEAFQSLVKLHRTIDVRSPSSKKYRVWMKDGRSEQSNASIWETPDGLVWQSSDGEFHAVHEDLSVFVEALAARRLTQLLQSNRASERQLGKQLMQQRGDKLFDALLKLARSTNSNLRMVAFRDLKGLLNRGPIRDRLMMRFLAEDSSVCLMGRAISRSHDHPRANEIRQVAMAMVKKELVSTEPHNFQSLNFACDCLAEVGDQKTADELAKLLVSTDKPSDLVRLMECMESIYGLPPFWHEVGICGNMTDEEWKQHDRNMRRLRGDQRDELLKWHKRHRAKDRKMQLAAAVDLWQDELAKVTTTFDRRYYNSALPDWRFESLLRCGPEVVPIIKAKQQETQDENARVTMEYVAARLTGKCDRDFVSKLLNGNRRQKTMACYIIAVTGQPDWKEQIDALQYTASTRNDIVDEETQLLRCAASLALLTCHSNDCLPLFEKAAAEGYANRVSHAKLRFCNSPQD